MSNYCIKAILLQNCGYSNLAKKILLDNNIKSNIIEINYEDKEKYKTNQINTYPQIYLIKKNSNGNLLLGGCTDLQNVINTFKNKKYDINKVNEFKNKYNWSKKAILRLIELIN